MKRKQVLKSFFYFSMVIAGLLFFAGCKNQHLPTSSVNGEGGGSGSAGGGSGSAGAAGLIIAFDESAMKCWSNGKDVKSGATITKGQELYFQATLPTGKKVKTWKAGTKELGKNQNSIGYKVDPQDADNGKITISYTEK